MAIARQIPVAATAHHMYSILLREALNFSQSDDTTIAGELRMVCAIHKEIDPSFSYEALATVILTELVDPRTTASDDRKTSRVERQILVQKLRCLIRRMATELGSNFDGCQLIASLLSFDVSSESWSRSDEEDKARLMFQCAILSADLVKKEKNPSGIALLKSSFRQSLIKIRKMLLSWYCSDFGPRFKDKLKKSSDAEEIGAGIPDFDSALTQNSEAVATPSWLRTMRCLLFLEDGESELMKRFLEPDFNVSEVEWATEAARINLCCKFGGVVSDEMIWIVLRSASKSVRGIDATMAISLLENLFANCAKERNGSLKVCDPMVVWELYNLVQYKPTKVASSPEDSSKITMKSLPR
jgi:hypothetical protein